MKNVSALPPLSVSVRRMRNGSGIGARSSSLSTRPPDISIPWVIFGVNRVVTEELCFSVLSLCRTLTASNG